jgi:N-acetylglutamate synthase-like GNAT family acetyltransferase
MVWPDWYGPSGNGSADVDLSDCLSSGPPLPRGLVALDVSGTPVGCVCLRDRSPGSDRYPGAWLTGLAVHPECRRSGIGLALIKAAEDRARQLDFAALFTTTGPAERLVLARGWEWIDVVATNGGEMNIYRHSCRV